MHEMTYLSELLDFDIFLGACTPPPPPPSLKNRAYVTRLSSCLFLYASHLHVHVHVL